MSQAPTAKRQRTEEPKDIEDQTPPVQSTYWYDDGNVILQAENTQFRVHRSLLSQHSNVFKDMFSLPQPATDPDVGCPIVLFSDKATDLECIMSVIYDSIRVYDMREKLSIDFLGATLRLGKKYDIDYLCKEGLKRLRLEFPTTLGKWKACSGGYSQIKLAESMGVGSMEPTVLGLCHELSIHSCLPPAYLFFVASNTLEEILESSVHSGGTLDHEVVLRCVRGRDKLIRAHYATLEAWVDKNLFLPSKFCSSKSTCAVNRVLVIRNLSLFDMEDGCLHCFLKPWDEEDVHDLDLCTSCLTSIEREYNRACEDLWFRLPTFFGLPPWDELKDFDM